MSSKQSYPKKKKKKLKRKIITLVYTRVLFKGLFLFGPNFYVIQKNLEEKI